MDSSESLSKAVLAELPSEVAVLDEEGVIVYTNRAWRRFAEENGLVGDSASLGANYLDACDASPDSASAREAADGIRSLLTGDADAFSMEYPCHSPAERRYFRMTAKRFNHAGEDRVLLVHDDVTDRRKVEERVRMQNDRLTRVAGILSHDLRSPLNVAAGYVEMLAEGEGHGSESDDEDRPNRDEMVARVRSALERMSAILDDTLTLARRTGVDGMETERVDLRTAAERAWANVQSDAAALDVRDTFTFEADASLLDSLFENLFRNSVEHGSTARQAESDDGVERGSTGSRPEADDITEHRSAGDQTASDAAAERGRPAVTVRVGSLDGDDGFYVEDDGPGLPREHRDEAFRAGFTTGDGDGNTGLGLAIVASVAESHGWRVGVTDAADGGARFEVRV